MDTKHTDSIKLYSQILGDLPRDNHKIEYLLVNAAIKSIDIMCLVESNLNWRSYNTYSNCENAI